MSEVWGQKARGQDLGDWFGKAVLSGRWVG